MIVHRRIPWRPILLLLTLTGCDHRSTAEYQLEEYENRIRYVTEESLPPATVRFPALPPLRERQYPLPDIRLTALEALSLLECPRLTQLIAQRNNSLGKQMQPSQLLYYEKKLIAELQACTHYLSQNNRKPALRNKLLSVLAQKTAALPAVQWNMLLSNTELAGQLSNVQRLLPLQGDHEGDHGRQGTLAALNYMQSYLASDHSGDPPYDQRSLEVQLQQFKASSYSGQLLASATALTNTLNRVAVMLEHSGTICPYHRPSVKMERLNNVFRRFYVDSIQSYLVKVVSGGREWRAALLPLLARLPAPPEQAMGNYLLAITETDSPGSVWGQLDKAIQRHTRSWQKVLGECQMQPGQKPAD